MKFLISIFSVLYIVNASAQVSLTLKDCEDLFQKNNLQLLAERFNIDVAQAGVIQAKIWDQPVFSSEINAYNTDHKNLFNIGRQGQVAAGVDQLLYLGGKKKKEVEWAKSNVNVSALAFEQLLKDLKFELQKSFYEIYFSQVEHNITSKQLGKIDSLIWAYQVQSQLGNVPLKDVVRLKSLALSFRNELAEITKNIFEQQQTLRTLLSIDESVNPIVNTEDLENRLNTSIIYTIQELVDRAKAHNPEYLLMKQLEENSQLMYQWQKSLSVPDINLGLGYDQRGSAFNNSVNLRAGIPIPLWNINKGNIQAAKIRIDQSKLGIDIKLNEITQNIINAVDYFKYLQSQYNQNNLAFQDFDTVYKGMVENFQKRNISMIEFTDFAESYNGNIQFINQQKKQALIYGLTLNNLVNDKIF